MPPMLEPLAPAATSARWRIVRLVLGIGNIGGQYAGTRHNVGFDVVDLLANRHGVGGWSRKHHASVAAWRSPHGQVLLVKPETYVNGSGEAVQALLAYGETVAASVT